MRVTVAVAVGFVNAGHSVGEILDAYPYLEREDIHAALEYTAMKGIGPEQSAP